MKQEIENRIGELRAQVKNTLASEPYSRLEFLEQLYSALYDEI